MTEGIEAICMWEKVKKKQNISLQKQRWGISLRNEFYENSGSTNTIKIKHFGGDYKIFCTYFLLSRPISIHRIYLCPVFINSIRASTSSKSS